MAERSENIHARSKVDDYTSYTEQDLQNALQDFLEEEKPPGEKTRMWNFRTIAGLAFLFVATTYFIKALGWSFFGPDVSNAVYWLPIVGGLLIVIVGFGFFSRERKHLRKNKRKKKRLYNNLKADRNGNSSSSFARSAASRFGLESYALRKNKKMFRSRTDKRVCGVCGGIARYFGISSTFVRLFFAIFTLLGYGFPVILYIALCFVLPKEPQALLGDDPGYDQI